MDAVSVVAAAGFRAAAAAAGIKARGGLDLAVIAADRPVPAAAVFTTSRAAAAPVAVSRIHLVDPHAKAVVVNSGCANAATGAAGLEAARTTAAAAARLLDCRPEEVLVASTGPIGTLLPVASLVGALPAATGALAADQQAGDDVAAAIMTTDTRPKQAVLTADGFVVGGVAKGAGMIRPDMATMLALITTDAAVEPATLRRSLAAAVDDSFHSLNVDGCQSTNDMVAALASGAAGTAPTEAMLTAAVTAVCRRLALHIASDAEGSTRVVKLRVRGATDAGAARWVGRLVADSGLVRASFYGGDANWGRILAALAVGPQPVDPDRVTISYAGTQVAAGGVAVPYDEAALLDTLRSGDFEVDIEIGSGPGTAEVITTDLTPEYVRVNGERS